MLNRKFEIFNTAVLYGNFAKAASVLNVTPSTVSHAINDLEKELGLKLFIRSQKGVSLTNDGRHLLPYIRRLQIVSDSLYQEVDQIHGLLKGTVVFSAPQNIAAIWLPKIIHEFKLLHPNIGMKIQQGTNLDILNWIKDSRTDFAFISGDPYVDNTKEIGCFTDELIFLAPKSFNFINGEPITIDTLRNNHILNLTQSYAPDVTDFLNTNHIKYDSRFSVNDYYTMSSLVSNGLGCCVMPKISVYNKYGDFTSHPIVANTKYHIHLKVHDHAYNGPASTVMRSFIINYINSNILKNEN